MSERLVYADLRARIDRGELRKGDIWNLVARAARQGDAEASFTLGYRYLVFGGPEHDKVRRWLVKAAQSGHELARKTLAEVDEIRWAKRRELLSAAQAGDLEAQCAYACIVSADWDELGKDLAAGRIYYGLAAKQGEGSAQYEYGLMLLNGEGGPVMFEEGRLWLERSAEAGYEDAARVLGIFFNGGALGFPRDPEQAAYWSRKVNER